MTALKKAWCTLGLALSLLFAPSLFASPYVEVGDAHLRDSIQVLAAGGFLHGPVNTYPLSWASIVRDLQRIPVQQLTAVQYEAYLRLLAALDFHTRSSYQALRLQGRSDPAMFHGYGQAAYEQGALAYAHEIQGEQVAVRIQTQVRSKPEGGDDYSFDGSYIAAVFGNWGVSYDQLAMWWGPGLDQALVHSNNARAVQALRLTRLGNEPFELPLLSLLGHWQATAYLGRSEKSGALGHHQVAGARFSATPIASLELGASYTGQWGGQGTGLSVMRNQYASVDARWSVRANVGLYGEYMQPQRKSTPHAYLLGADLSFSSFGLQDKASTLANRSALQRVFVEFSQLGSVYDDSIDLAGYRRWGRTVGAAIDQDARGIALGYNRYTANGRGIELRLRHLELGAQNLWVRQGYIHPALQEQLATKQQLAELEVERFAVSFMYQYPLSNSLVRLGVEHWQDSFKKPLTGLALKADSETNISISWEFRW